MARYPIIDIVGLEIEAERIYSNAITKKINSSVWKLDHDASIESDGFMDNRGTKFINLPDSIRKNLPVGAMLLGTEIVLNPPYNTEQGDQCGLLERIEELTSTLMYLGEDEDNVRAGIHFHISMPMGLKLVKFIMQLGAYLEDTFFLLGGQGRLFRGAVKNESQYCRPITGVGPQCVMTVQGKIAQVYDIDDLLNAKTSNEFWWRYGNLQAGNEVGRYHPARYTWLNLYSLLAHGSLEFRCFNTTLDPYKIYHELMFCRSFCQFAISQVYGSENHTFESNSIYDNRSKKDILNTFQEFCFLAGIPPERSNLLGDIISKSTQFVLPERYVFSHLIEKGHYSFDFSNCAEVKYIDSDDVYIAKIDDIHARHGDR